MDILSSHVTADDFARRFSQRTGNLMWFLGAGASAAAGIPTALDMIWEFKQQLFVSQRRVSPRAVTDLSSLAIRSQLQAHIDSSGTLPAPGAADEYAALFEAVYPAEADRRAYLESKISGARPSYGHLALATLMRALQARLIWTTNFDPLIADACAKVYGATGPLATVGLENPDSATQLINSGRWPVEIKLHGDFRSRRLKNTIDELRLQDRRLRQIFISSCRRFGLVLVGYSGRDDSIMEALEEVLQDEAAGTVFSAGLFWLHRGEDPPLPRVERLLEKALKAGVEAALVKVESFDEVLRDLLRLVKDLDTAILETFSEQRPRWSAAPFPSGKQSWPVVRLNALPVIQIPNLCRRVVCAVGGHAEARAAIEQAGVDILVARTKSGVLAFGTDSDVRAAFTPHGIMEFDLHTIESYRLRFESGERGLLRDAIARALTKQRCLSLVRRRSADLLFPADPGSEMWEKLKSLVGPLSGPVPGALGLQWHEGVGTRLDWANDKLWLLIEPRTVFGGINDAHKASAADFARERSVTRYNKKYNDLVAFWAQTLAGDGGDLRAFSIGDGVDAVFRLAPDTGFSWRAGA